MRRRRPALHRSLRLGYLSFWDPDEATYAETTREMLASHSWLVPTYVTPFFDKSPLFYSGGWRRCGVQGSIRTTMTFG